MKNYLFTISLLFTTFISAQNTFLNNGSKVGIGTITPSSLLELKSSGQTELTISGDNNGAINAGLVFKAYNSVNQRGLGMFMYDTGGQNEWFAGRPYSGSDAFVIYRRDNITNHDVLTSSLSHNSGNKITKALFSINDKGNVGIGTKAPSNVQNWHGALDVHGSGHSKILATSNTAGVKTGIFSHGSNWKGIVGRLGTESNHDLRLMAGYGKDQMTIKTNGNVGIGTSTPSQKFEIFNPTAFNVNMESQNQDHISLVSNDPGIGNFFGGITWKSGGRRRASIVATREHSDSDHVGLAFFTKGVDGPGPIDESMRITRYGNVGIGTATPNAKLTVKGKIHTQEVKVDLAGAVAPDYVFLEDYNLRTIEQVSQHIKEKGHLPNIPSAKTMEKEGINLKEMNLKLLEKIEELTLYTIDQEKQLQQQHITNQKLDTKNQELEARLVKIEAWLSKR